MGASTKTSVVFRADAATWIGTGHIMRCLTLADALCDAGAVCMFVCREHQGNMIEAVRGRGYEVAALSPAAPEAMRAGPSYRDWLGADWKSDAAETRRAIGDIPVDWVIVDHYGIDARWHNAVRSRAQRIAAIDDIAGRPFGVDLLINPNLGTTAESYGRDETGSKMLLGPKFALLRPQFAEARRALSRRDGRAERLLICFGGTDYGNATKAAVTAALDASLPDIDVVVVVGACYPHVSDLAQCVDRNPRITLLSAVVNMADLMVASDLFLGAGGGMTWERAAVGLPALVVSLAENQVHASQNADIAGIQTYIGDARALSTADYIEQLGLSLSDPEKLRRQEAAGLALVDGCGTARVVQELLS